MIIKTHFVLWNLITFRKNAYKGLDADKQLKIKFKLETLAIKIMSSCVAISSSK